MGIARTGWQALTWGRITTRGWTLLAECADRGVGWLWKLLDPSGHAARVGRAGDAWEAMKQADSAAKQEGADP